MVYIPGPSSSIVYISVSPLPTDCHFNIDDKKTIEGGGSRKQKSACWYRIDDVVRDALHSHNPIWLTTLHSQQVNTINLRFRFGSVGVVFWPFDLIHRVWFSFIWEFLFLLSSPLQICIYFSDLYLHLIWSETSAVVFCFLHAFFSEIKQCLSLRLSLERKHYPLHKQTNMMQLGMEQSWSPTRPTSMESCGAEYRGISASSMNGLYGSAAASSRNSVRSSCGGTLSNSISIVPDAPSSFPHYSYPCYIITAL